MNDNFRNQLIFVPCDFTALAFHAIEHGAYMAKAMNCNMTLFHAVKREIEITPLTKKLNVVAEECYAKLDVRPNVIVRLGKNPYSAIKDAAIELNPVLVVLKTAGGVHTINILSGTSIPFLVIQGPQTREAITDISFPINFLNKHDEKLIRVMFFSGYYPNALMHIITPTGKDSLKDRLVSQSVATTVKVMANNKIKVDVITHNNHVNDAATILELSKGMDMIVTQIEEVSWIRKLLFGLREEKLIVNDDKIPILCFRNVKDFN